MGTTGSTQKIISYNISETEKINGEDRTAELVIIITVSIILVVVFAVVLVIYFWTEHKAT